ncbi:MAG: winged helix-turn-helix transcriptional regulator [Candidatus Methanoperedens sp.]|uniref:winged helix-turn-helix transcriptional regulator n=1 Tax=Candidatus Methanoperedens sp. BLZ2 TaxID=2035255 RepID=UPI0015967837|nr:winged helix-turn-helix transcriptional regulator [Candidatus Methanoperedens sp. BLZ2]MBZ0177431.1 winged helix-turn-helix transcriptional regulator [Candidatus Methanoperedens nitroreducens]MCX9079816.1 winged helix-turn-helix transcriptional regulator [Candidatus Methanoperedens sp.]MCX9085957.1 winged helix-turn-helix transcriptional regulator [Candidatus Methanoperedens sp.]
MERKTTTLTWLSIRPRIFLLYFFILLSVSTAYATEYTVRPSQSNQFGASVAGEDVHEIEVKPIPYWLFLLLLGFTKVTSSPETFFPIRLFPILCGYKRLNSSNILENMNREKLYGFIKSFPGSYFSEIIKETGLNKGSVEYHLKTMETKEIIESYKTNGKLRYFLNHSTYNKEERTVISALKNDTHRRIILGILGNQNINHKTLAEGIGVSSPTLTQHIKHLKEQGIVKADTNGRYTIYSINSNYFDSLQEYLNKTSS